MRHYAFYKMSLLPIFKKQDLWSLGHMTQVAAMPIYSKTIQNICNQNAMTMYVAEGASAHDSLVKCLNSGLLRNSLLIRFNFTKHQ